MSSPIRRHPTADPLGPCTFLVQVVFRRWSYCGRPAPSIWLAGSRGFYRRCDLHQPSQLDRYDSAQGHQA